MKRLTDKDVGFGVLLLVFGLPVLAGDVDPARQIPGYLQAGNPIDFGSGAKVQRETDYQGAFAANPLVFIRVYSSMDRTTPVSSLGRHWFSNYDRHVAVATDTEADMQVTVYRGDGRAFDFVRDDPDGLFVPDPDIKSRLVEILDNSGTRQGWEYHALDGSIEVYDDDGRLIHITNQQGLKLTLDYDVNSRLESVSDAHGRSLGFAYDDDRLVAMTDPAGNITTYEYDDPGNLLSVAYPGAGNDPQDRPLRIYHYEDPDHPHALTGITDENGERYATWTYNEDGHAVSGERAGGVDRIEVEYHEDGSTTVTDALGNARTYTFEVIHGAIKPVHVSGPCTSCAGQAQSYTYDADGFITSSVDFNGNTTTWQHDVRGLEISRTEAAGTDIERTISTVWHAEFRLPVAITEPGRETTMTYDETGRRLAQTQTDSATGASRTTTYAYYGPEDGPGLAGLLKSIQGPRTDVTELTTHEYDSQGNLARMINSLGHVTEITHHDAHGRPLTIIDPNGAVTELAYDVRGRLIARTHANQATSLDYDPAGNLVQVTLPNGASIMNTYDAAHRLIAVEDSLGNRIDYTLDLMGNRSEETISDSSGVLRHTLARTHDVFSQVIEITGGAGQTTAFAYDANGNPVTITEPGNRSISQIFDAHDRLVSRQDALDGITAFNHDHRDNLVAVTDPRGLTTSYAYDGLDNLVEQSSPDTGVTLYQYDAAGNRISQTDARHVTTGYDHDSLSRLTQITYPDSSFNVSLQYDDCSNGIGRLCTMQDGSGSTQYQYDVRGNLVAQTVAVDATVHNIQYAYDSMNQLVQITYPSGRTVDYVRNLAGQVVEIRTSHDEETRVLAEDLDWLPFGPMQSLSYGNGITLERDFDMDYRLVTQSAGQIQNLGWVHDAADNIIAITDGINPERSQDLAYDDLNRLTGASGAYGNHDYGYDPVGNRLHLITDGYSESYGYPEDANRLQTVANSIVLHHAYDASGNTTDNSRYGFEYGDHNRMVRAVLAGIPVAEYTYNGRGERVRKEAQQTTLYFYDLNGQLIAETDANGNVRKEYFYLDGVPLALYAERSRKEMPGQARGQGRLHATPEHRLDQLRQQREKFQEQSQRLAGRGNAAAAMQSQIHRLNEEIESLQQQVTTGKLFFIHTDHLGTPHKLTDTDREIVWDAVYEPFGQASLKIEEVTFNLRFPGQYFDTETGLHYNYFRDYDPTIGRYIQSDPIGLGGGINTYVYAGNNPVTSFDPYGLVEWRARYSGGGYYVYVGMGMHYFNLESECVNGKRAKARVVLVGPGIGGAAGWTTLAAEYRKDLIFKDSNLIPDPMVFNGMGGMLDAGVSVAPAGFGVKRIRLGRAEYVEGTGMGVTSAIEIGGSVMVGSSTVLSGKLINCECDMQL